MRRALAACGPTLTRGLCSSSLGFQSTLTGTAALNSDALLDIKPGSVILVVNTASLCGYTPQLAQLQELHEKYNTKGLVVLAIPSNEFGEQEPWTEDKIEDFYSKDYDVTFQVSAKQLVSTPAPEQHPFYKQLSSEFGEMILPQWNFAKFLVSKDGELAGMFPPEMEPTEQGIVDAIESALA